MGVKNFFKIILFQKEDNKEVYHLSILTLVDNPQLALAGLVWTQGVWLWALIASGWSWIVGLILVDVFVFVRRWALLKQRRSGENILKGGGDRKIVLSNISLITIVSIEIFVATQVSHDRVAIAGLILALGFSAYSIAFFSAFERLAKLNLLLLCGSLGLGLITGPSPLLVPFGLIVPAGLVVYWTMVQLMHVTLLNAIRNHVASRAQSLQDPLTKLPNRHFMRDELERCLSSTANSDAFSEFAVLYLDLDGFKQINDRFGHAAGDWVLIHVADVLRRSLAPNEIACRIGGDEYIVILPSADEARVRTVGQAVIEAISGPFDIGRTIPARIGVSIGAVIARDASRSIDDLLEEADASLYEAKRLGRGRLQFGRLALAGTDAERNVRSRYAPASVATAGLGS